MFPQTRQCDRPVAAFSCRLLSTSTAAASGRPFISPRCPAEPVHVASFSPSLDPASSRDDLLCSKGRGLQSFFFLPRVLWRLQVARVPRSCSDASTSRTGAWCVDGSAGASQMKVLDCVRVNMALVKAAEKGDMALMEAICTDNYASLNSVNVSTAMNRAGRLLSSRDATPHMRAVFRDRLLPLLESKLVESLDSFDARCLALFAHGLAKVHYKDLCRTRLVPPQHDVFDLILARALAMKGSFGGTGRELTNLVWALANQGFEDDGRVLELLQDNLSGVMRFDPQGIANLTWSIATLRLRDHQLCRTLAHAAQAKMPHFIPQGVANITWGFATLGVYIPELLDAVDAHWSHRLHEFQPQGISNMAWAFATLKLSHRNHFIARLAEAAKPNLHKYSPLGIANVLWGLATLGHRDEELLSLSADVIMDKVHKYDATNVSMVLWALATFGFRNDALLAKVSEHLMHTVDSASMQSISNTTWALATLAYCPAPLLIKLADRTVEQVAAFDEQGMSLMAWGFASLGVRHDGMFAALAEESARRLHEFTPQGVSNLLWGFSTLGYASPTLYAAAGDIVHAHIAQYDGQSVSVIAWAFATCMIRHDAMFQRISSLLMAPLPDGSYAISSYDEQSIANLTWSFAKLGYPDTPLFSHVAEVCVARMNDFSLRGTSSLLWAYARAKIVHGPLFESVLLHLQSLFQDLLDSDAAVPQRNDKDVVIGQELYVLFWSLATLGLRDENTLQLGMRVFERFCPRDKLKQVASLGWALVALKAQWLLGTVLRHMEVLEPELTDWETMGQLSVIILSLNLEAPQLNHMIPAQLREKVSSAICHHSYGVRTSSMLHGSVASELRMLRSDFVEELQVDSYFIDLAFPKHKVALEVDGPEHFLSSGAFDGGSLLKDRLLTLLGWKVLHVKYYDWIVLTHAHDRRQYLRNLLDQAKLL